MSAIGDYIHLHAENYNKHGITMRGEATTYNFVAQKERINKKIGGGSRFCRFNLVRESIRINPIATRFEHFRRSSNSSRSAKNFGREIPRDFRSD